MEGNERKLCYCAEYESNCTDIFCAAIIFAFRYNNILFRNMIPMLKGLIKNVGTYIAEINSVKLIVIILL